MDKIQSLGQKAGMLGHALTELPGKAAQLRESITMSAEELKQIKSNVQSSLHGLHANSEEHLLQSMREISDSADLFRQVGYELACLDLDLGLSHRLTLRLQKFESASQATFNTVHSQQMSASVRAILSNIQKAEETAANIELTNLEYEGITLHIGAVPISRLCWSAVKLQPNPAPTPCPVPTTPGKPPVVQVFGESPIGNLFEKRTTSTATVVPAPEQPAISNATNLLPIAPPATPVAIPSSAAPSAKWTKESLERFKQMPRGSKYR